LLNFCYFRKAAESEQPPKIKKCAKSGHPDLASHDSLNVYFLENLWAYLGTNVSVAGIFPIGSKSAPAQKGTML
jgi:hypothetical protein